MFGVMVDIGLKFLSAPGHCTPMGYWKSRMVSLKIVCVEVLRPSQPNGVMSSAVSLFNHTFTGQA